MIARSKLIPRMCGPILRWIDDEQFIVLYRGREILGHRDYWEVTP